MYEQHAWECVGMEWVTVGKADVGMRVLWAGRHRIKKLYLNLSMQLERVLQIYLGIGAITILKKYNIYSFPLSEHFLIR